MPDELAALSLPSVQALKPGARTTGCSPAPGVFFFSKLFLCLSVLLRSAPPLSPSVASALMSMLMERQVNRLSAAPSEYVPLLGFCSVSVLPKSIFYLLSLSPFSFSVSVILFFTLSLYIYLFCSLPLILSF